MHNCLARAQREKKEEMERVAVSVFSFLLEQVRSHGQRGRVATCLFDTDSFIDYKT